MHSTDILRMKGAVALSAVLAMGLILAGCGGGGADGPSTSMPDAPETPDNGNGNGNGGTDMTDLGEWELIREGGVSVGYEHSGHDLLAKFDSRGANPTITASSSDHQPTVAGTWTGRWAARYTALESDYGEYDESDSGEARINVTISGSSVRAKLTYSGIDVVGLPSSLSTDYASVHNGRFSPVFRVSIPTESGTINASLGGTGQFGGTDQNGVVGYLTSPTLEIRSAFYGDRE